jgi:hypothetical protein
MWNLKIQIMPNSLEQKIRAIEDEQYEQAEKEHVAFHDQTKRDEAMQFLGGAMAIDRLKEHLASQVIAALMTIEDQKLYLDYGYSRFAEFLDQCEFSKMSKSQFYKLRDLYLKEGPERYDLFTDWKVPLTTRKLLAAGEVSVEIEGDEVVIGGEERVNVAESRTIKAIIEKLVKEKSALADDLQKQETKLEKQSEKLKQGQADYEELQRNFDSLKDADPFDRALSSAVYSLLNLCESVGQLPDAKRQARANDDVRLFANLWFRVRDAYGSPMALVDIDTQSHSEFDKKIESILAEDGDFGDE